MFMAVAEKKGWGVFFADALRTHGATAGRGCLSPETQRRGEDTPCQRARRTGRSPVKRPPYQSPERSESAYRRGGYGGVQPRHLGESRPNGDGRDPDLVGGGNGRTRDTSACSSLGTNKTGGSPERKKPESDGR